MCVTPQTKRFVTYTHTRRVCVTNIYESLASHILFLFSAIGPILSLGRERERVVTTTQQTTETVWPVQNY